MILYKYMKFAAARKVLARNSIGFSRASYFNDPFDMPMDFAFEGGNYLGEVVDNYEAGLKGQIWEKETAFLSLTRTPTNALMWAHYADRHRGVVLAINMVAAGLLKTDSNLIPAHLGSVIYSRHRPSGPYYSEFSIPTPVGGNCSFIIERYEKWQRLFLTKPMEWAYEEEVRVGKCISGLEEGICENGSGSFEVIAGDIGPLHCFLMPEGSIVGLFFGARVEGHEIRETMFQFPNVKYKRAILDHRKFLVDLETVE